MHCLHCIHFNKLDYKIFNPTFYTQSSAKHKKRSCSVLLFKTYNCNVPVSHEEMSSIFSSKTLDQSRSRYRLKLSDWGKARHQQDSLLASQTVSSGRVLSPSILRRILNFKKSAQSLELHATETLNNSLVCQDQLRITDHSKKAITFITGLSLSRTKLFLKIKAWRKIKK